MQNTFEKRWHNMSILQIIHFYSYLIVRYKSFQNEKKFSDWKQSELIKPSEEKIEFEKFRLQIQAINRINRVPTKCTSYSSIYAMKLRLSTSYGLFKVIELDRVSEPPGLILGRLRLPGNFNKNLEDWNLMSKFMVMKIYHI